jgi:hypothetical protein
MIGVNTRDDSLAVWFSDGAQRRESAGSRGFREKGEI